MLFAESATVVAVLVLFPVTVRVLFPVVVRVLFPSKSSFAVSGAEMTTDFFSADIFGLLFCEVPCLLFLFFATGYKGFRFVGFTTFRARNFASRLATLLPLGTEFVQNIKT